MPLSVSEERESGALSPMNLAPLLEGPVAFQVVQEDRENGGDRFHQQQLQPPLQLPQQQQPQLQLPPPTSSTRRHVKPLLMQTQTSTTISSAESSPSPSSPLSSATATVISTTSSSSSGALLSIERDATVGSADRERQELLGPEVLAHHGVGESEANGTTSINHAPPKILVHRPDSFSNKSHQQRAENYSMYSNSRTNNSSKSYPHHYRYEGSLNSLLSLSGLRSRIQALNLNLTQHSDHFDARGILGIVRRWLLHQWFFVGLILAVLIARLWPDLGKTKGVLHPEYTVKLFSVFVLFFISGLSIRTSELKAALSNVRSHFTVQIFSFIFIPLFFKVILIPILSLLTHIISAESTAQEKINMITTGNSNGGGIFAALLQLRPRFSSALLDGFMVLACMPPPVSSAVVLTRTSNGSEAIAVFNSALGSLLGIFLTPLLLLVSLGTEVSVPVNQILVSLLFTVVIPLLLGQFIRMRHEFQAQEWQSRYRLSEVSSSILLLVIFSAFSDTFSSHVDLDSYSVCCVLVIVVASQCLFLYSSRWVAVRLARLSREDAVAVMFCASHKSLTLGFPLLKIMFGTSPLLSLIALPLILFHPTQILVGGMIVEPLRHWVDGEQYPVNK